MSRSRRKTGSVLGAVAAVAVTLLRPWPDNPRRISGERLEALKQSMVADPAMLWARPLLALRDGTVFSGNQRLRVALELGWESIPVLYVDLEWDRARTWALRDNAAYGEWDEPVLAELLAELAAEGIDLILTGLTGGDIDRILAGIPTPVEPDQALELPTGLPDSRPGEVYELGNHRLLCGDARSSDDLAALIGTEKVELVLTDPPYGVSYTGKTRAELTIRNDGEEGLEPLLTDAFAAINPFLAPAARFYVFAPAGPLGTVFRRSIDTAGWQLHQSLVWVKDAIVLGHSDYHYRHEDILYGRTPGPGPVDVVDERVLEDAEILERVDESPDVVVGVLEEARVHLHLAREHGLEVVRDLVPRGDLLRAGGQLRLRGHDSQLLLPSQDLLT